MNGITVDGGALIASGCRRTRRRHLQFMVFDAASGRLRGPPPKATAPAPRQGAGDGGRHQLRRRPRSGGLHQPGVALQGFSTPAFARYAGQPAVAGGLVNVMQGWELPTDDQLQPGRCRAAGRGPCGGSGRSSTAPTSPALGCRVAISPSTPTGSTSTTGTKVTGSRPWLPSTAGPAPGCGRTPSPGDGAPTVANGVVFVADEIGGRRLSRRYGCRAVALPRHRRRHDPIVANGRLYVGLRPAGSSGPANLSMFKLNAAALDGEPE